LPTEIVNKKAIKQLASPDGFVYVATDGELMKVGISRDADRRIRGLSTATGRDVTLVRAFPMRMALARNVEATVHDALDALRLKGEWFRCPVEVALEAVNAAIETAKEDEIEPEGGGVSEEDTPVSQEDRGCVGGRHLGVSEEDTLNLHLTKKSNLSARGRSPLVSGDLGTLEELKAAIFNDPLCHKPT
jgi:hypothetical protein